MQKSTDVSASSDIQQKESMLTSYTNQLNDLQKKAMNIAQDHLGLSFNLTKSVGYQEYISSKK